MEDVGIFYGNWVFLQPFGIFYGSLVSIFPFWYFVPRKIWQPWFQTQQFLNTAPPASNARMAAEQ
jgi:hypothetical protein